MVTRNSLFFSEIVGKEEQVWSLGFGVWSFGAVES
jgi:hypothetical protein